MADGKVETFDNLIADRFYYVREGAGVVSSNPLRPARRSVWTIEGTNDDVSVKSP